MAENLDPVIAIPITVAMIAALFLIFIIGYTLFEKHQKNRWKCVAEGRYKFSLSERDRRTRHNGVHYTKKTVFLENGQRVTLTNPKTCLPAKGTNIRIFKNKLDEDRIEIVKTAE